MVILKRKVKAKILYSHGNKISKIRQVHNLKSRVLLSNMFLTGKNSEK